MVEKVHEQPIFSSTAAALMIFGLEGLFGKRACLLTELFPKAKNGFDSMIEDIFGRNVQLCRKFAKFSTHSEPSNEALRHLALKAAMVYEVGTSKSQDVTQRVIDRTVEKVQEQFASNAYVNDLEELGDYRKEPRVLPKKAAKGK